MSVAIFYIPHQDDESLWTNLAIAKAVHDDGLEVHTVLMTNAFGFQWPQLATGTGGACTIGHGVTHNFGWSRAQYQGFRDAEYAASAAALGVDSGKIEYATGRGTDYQMTVFWAIDRMLEYAAAYPGARHNTTSWHDSHPEHLALGLALKALVDCGTISDARFYLRTEYAAGFDGTAETGSGTAVTAATAGPNSYTTYDGTSHFAIGYHGVKSLLDDQIAGPHNKWHTAVQNR